MAKSNTRLELTWIGKENRPKLEPRILVKDTGKSHHAPFRAGNSAIFDNRLIFGDNLLALKALEQEFAGKVKCVYVDPPFNTGHPLCGAGGGHGNGPIHHGGTNARSESFPSCGGRGFSA